jgi:hypothetical protein
MAVARSCLTLWVYCIVVRMLFDPPMTAPGLSLNDQKRTQVGEGSWMSQFGLVKVN